MPEVKSITFLGVGYVGLVSSACFADTGLFVTCYDIDQKKIRDLQQGIIPFYEPGLEELVHRNLKAGRLKFTNNIAEAIAKSAVCFIAVSTPSAADGSCDLSHVMEAAKSIGAHMIEPCVIVIKSTVPVGTSKEVRRVITSHLRSSIDFDVVSNPEFLKEGSAIADCMKPDRIILGVDTEAALHLMKELYTPFTLNRDRMIVMDSASAEMTKYVANAMLASRISFMNEMAGLCEKLGANIHAVRQGIGTDHRIGSHFLYAGVGYGGSCFPKDIRALESMAKKVNYETPILTAIDSINEKQKKVLAHKIAAHFGGVAGKTIAIWGIAFKPETDDFREAPSLQLIETLLSQGAHLRVYDPVAMPKAQQKLNHSHIAWCSNEYEAAKDSDAIALLTEWKQFRGVDLDMIRSQMKGNGFFDGRNQYQKSKMEEKGFCYFGIGVP